MRSSGEAAALLGVSSLDLARVDIVADFALISGVFRQGWPGSLLKTV
jgi:hypothetical protein